MYVCTLLANYLIRYSAFFFDYQSEYVFFFLNTGLQIKQITSKETYCANFYFGIVIEYVYILKAPVRSF